MFIKRNEKGNIILIAAKVTDDILLAGPIEELNKFTTAISTKYHVRKSIIDDTIQFYGREITKDQLGNIIMDMSQFLHKINPIKLDKNRRNQCGEKV